MANVQSKENMTIAIREYTDSIYACKITADKTAATSGIPYIHTQPETNKVFVFIPLVLTDPKRRVHQESRRSCTRHQTLTRRWNSNSNPEDNGKDF